MKNRRHTDVPSLMASTGEGLNPSLYARLEKISGGDVVIANEGEEMVFGAPMINRETGRLEPNIVWPGEYYRISCPYCDDTRQRLWVNHRYNTVDEATGRLMDWLAVCYNEQCLSDYENRTDLNDRLFGFVNFDVRYREAKQVVIKPGKVVDATLHAVPMPGECPRVDKLSPRHDAVRYLVSRNYDVGRLGRVYKVAFCSEANFLYPQVEGRIIVPVYMNGEMVGWQGRYVGEIDFKARKIPKYYTMPHFPRRLAMYNWDRASKGKVLVVTEGVSDVWRVGRAGVALLGNSLSRDHQAVVTSWDKGKGRVVVVLLDGEAVDEASAVAAKLKEAVRKASVVTVSLPDRRDPGGFDTDVLWKLIRGACAEQGTVIES